MSSEHQLQYEIAEFRDVASCADIPTDDANDIYECTKDAFGDAIPDEIAREQMCISDQLVVARVHEDGVSKVRGFIATAIRSMSEEFEDERYPSEKGACSIVSALGTAYRGLGLYNALNKRRMEFVLEKDVNHLFCTTQKPRIQEGNTRTMDELIEEGKLCSYDFDRFVVPEFYGKMVTPIRHFGRTVIYNDLDYERGDAAVLTWRFQ